MHYMFWGDAEFFIKYLIRGAGAKTIHSYDCPFEAYIVFPSQPYARFHSHPGLDIRREHMIAVLGWLMIEDFPAREGNDPYAKTLRRKMFPCFEGYGHLRSGSN